MKNNKLPPALPNLTGIYSPQVYDSLSLGDRADHRISMFSRCPKATSGGSISLRSRTGHIFPAAAPPTPSKVPKLVCRRTEYSRMLVLICACFHVCYATRRMTAFRWKSFFKKNIIAEQQYFGPLTGISDRAFCSCLSSEQGGIWTVIGCRSTSFHTWVFIRRRVSIA